MLMVMTTVTLPSMQVCGTDAAARALAGRLGLELAAQPRAHFCLGYRDGALVLQDLTRPDERPLCLDLVPTLSQRRSLGLVGRALGRGVQQVFDATAGLGGDAALFASRGLQVVAFERSAVVFALLEDALRRAHEGAPAASARIALYFGDAREALRRLPPMEVVYIDAMFPPKRKRSAATRKELRMLQDLVGHDDDAAELLRAARAAALKRVVVKRADDTPAIAPPDMSYSGTTVRYDVYLIHARHV